MLSKIFSSKKDDETPKPVVDLDYVKSGDLMLTEDLREALEQDRALLDEFSGEQEKVLREADEVVQEDAQKSFINLQRIKHGYCPECGGFLKQNTSSNICENCGWYKYDKPKYGKTIVHLHGNDGIVEGQYAYTLKSGVILVTNGEVIVAKIPADAYSWVEYIWSEDELEQRRRTLTEHLQLQCGWCGKDADVNKDGFHLAHVAFGTSQERFCFCSDECYEAFRKLYPSRVHRNCYESNCYECNKCIKRYGDEAEGIRTLAKDHLKMKKPQQQ